VAVIVKKAREGDDQQHDAAEQTDQLEISKAEDVDLAPRFHARPKLSAA
jgi:hypothetical protein